MCIEPQLTLISVKYCKGNPYKAKKKTIQKLSEQTNTKSLKRQTSSNTREPVYNTLIATKLSSLWVVGGGGREGRGVELESLFQKPCHEHKTQDNIKLLYWLEIQRELAVSLGFLVKNN